VKNDHRSKFSKLRKKKPEKIRASTGFKPVMEVTGHGFESH